MPLAEAACVSRTVEPSEEMIFSSCNATSGWSECCVETGWQEDSSGRREGKLKLAQIEMKQTKAEEGVLESGSRNGGEISRKHLVTYLEIQQRRQVAETLCQREVAVDDSAGVAKDHRKLVLDLLCKWADVSPSGLSVVRTNRWRNWTGPACGDAAWTTSRDSRTLWAI